jgi:hypothetical protein
MKVSNISDSLTRDPDLTMLRIVLQAKLDYDNKLFWLFILFTDSDSASGEMVQSKELF